MARLVTKSFIETIKEINRVKGSYKATGKFLGVSDMQIMRWVKGQGETIKESTYAIIYPKIKDIYQEKNSQYKEPASIIDNSVLELINSFSHDDIEIIQYLNRPENKRTRLKLQMEIEDSKQSVYSQAAEAGGDYNADK